MKRWFHKEDGGLMGGKTSYLRVYSDTSREYIPINLGYACAICKYLVYNPAMDQNCARFSDLPEELQAAALGEML